MNIKIACLKFLNLNLRDSSLHLLRGYIGNMYKEYDLIHNHTSSGSVIARYPLIQFKNINNTPSIFAIGDKAIEVLSKVFLSADKINIRGIDIPIYEKDFSIKNVEIGYSEQFCVYEFASPIIALNEKNYFNYKSVVTLEEKIAIVERALTNHILAMSKGLGVWLESNQKIETKFNFKHIIVKLKGINMTGFVGIFKTNYIIPDFIGLGKSPSRGFGTVIKFL